MRIMKFSLNTTKQLVSVINYSMNSTILMPFKRLDLFIRSSGNNSCVCLFWRFLRWNHLNKSIALLIYGIFASKIQINKQKVKAKTRRSAYLNIQKHPKNPLKLTQLLEFLIQMTDILRIWVLQRLQGQYNLHLRFLKITKKNSLLKSIIGIKIF